MPDEPFRILVVCVGNICRSPLTERLLRIRLAASVPEERFAVESAGVGAVVGHAMHDPDAAELTRLGGDPAGHLARQLTVEMVAEAELVLTATRRVREATLVELPAALRRTFTLLEFARLCRGLAEDESTNTPARLVAAAATHRTLAAGVEQDVTDPVGGDDVVHREVAEVIDGAVTDIVARLAPLLAR